MPCWPTDGMLRMMTSKRGPWPSWRKWIEFRTAPMHLRPSNGMRPVCRDDRGRYSAPVPIGPGDQERNDNTAIRPQGAPRDCNARRSSAPAQGGSSRPDGAGSRTAGLVAQQTAGCGGHAVGGGNPFINGLPFDAILQQDLAAGAKKLDASKRREIAESVINGRKSGAEMARLYNISQPTVSRIVTQHQTGRARFTVQTP
jgi:hypothetical protein